MLAPASPFPMFICLACRMLTTLACPESESHVSAKSALLKTYLDTGAPGTPPCPGMLHRSQRYGQHLAIMSVDSNGTKHGYILWTSLLFVWGVVKPPGVVLGARIMFLS